MLLSMLSSKLSSNHIFMAHKKKPITRKLTKLGGGRSYGVTIPMQAIKAFHWRERQKLVIQIDKRRKRITTEDWPRKKTMG